MAAIDAQGITVTVGDGEAGTATIGGIGSIEFSGSETTIKDRTTLASSAKEFGAGLIDYGNFTMEFALRDVNDAGQAELLEMQAAAEIREFVVTLPSGTLTTATFDGLVTSLSLNGGVDEDVSGSCEVKIDGAIVWS